MKIPFKIRKILNKLKKKNIQQDSFDPTEEQLKSMIEKLGKDVVVYGNKEQMSTVRRIKEDIK